MSKRSADRQIRRWQTEVAERLGIHGADISRILPIVFLAPKITKATLTGRQPADLTIAKLTRMPNLPMSWSEAALLDL